MCKIRTATHRAKTWRRRSSGFVTVAMIILTPLALTTLAAISALVLILKYEVASAAKCDQAVFQIQEQRAKRLNELLRHNANARRLLAQKQIWQTRMLAAKASGNTAALALCLIKLSLITNQQMALATVQRAIIDAANLESRTAARVATRQMPSSSTQLIPNVLAVEPLQPGEIAPEYKPARQFFARQKIVMTYSTLMATLIGRDLLKLINETNPPFYIAGLRHDCAASIVKRSPSLPYQAQMTSPMADKYQ